MSYLDHNHTSYRKSTLVAVAVIEAVAIYAVVSGLAGTFVGPTPRDPFVATQVTLDPPKPLPTPTAKASDVAKYVPQSADPIKSGPIIAIEPFPQSPASPGPMLMPDLALPPPKPPVFAPRMAKPLGRTSGWATSNDYPARDLREGNAGITGFRLTIGADGKVTECTVTSSSGFSGLDKATCANVARRARFEPARDDSGAPVVGTYANNIRWVIPE